MDSIVKVVNTTRATSLSFHLTSRVDQPLNDPSKMNAYKDFEFPSSPSDNLTRPRNKRILHFSDGTLEVDDDEDDDDVDGNQTRTVDREIPVDPQKLSWGPWMWYYTVFAGSKTLEACDYLGESLASFFGITTPKYQYEITEYNRIKREEQEDRENEFEKNFNSVECGLQGFQMGNEQKKGRTSEVFHLEPVSSRTEVGPIA